MDVYRFAAENQFLLDAGDWDGYEDAARVAAEGSAGTRLIRKIGDIDLGRYTGELEELLATAASKAEELSPAAMYFEYDLDNRWESAVFYCRSLEPPFVPFEEWPADFETYTEGPDLPQFAKHFARHSWSQANDSQAVIILTVARTMAAFGRALSRTGAGPRPWGVGFTTRARS